MKGAFSALVASTLLLGMGVAPSSAWAQKKKVVLEQFNGPSSDRFRQMVQSSLSKMGDIELISDKKVASAEADLGLISVADSYAAVSKQLGNAAFVGGSMSSAKKPKAKLVVKGPDGSPLGDESWTGDNTNKLLSAIGGSVGSKLDSILAKAKAGSAGASEAKESKKAPEPIAAAPEEKPAPAPKESKKAAKADDDDWQSTSKKKPAAKPAETAEGEKSADADAETTVKADADSDESPSGPSDMKLLFVLGMKFMGRHFVYNDNKVGGQQDYKLPKSLVPYVPTPNVTVEFFPVKWVGLSLAGEMSIGLISKDKGDNLYRTVAYAYTAGARGDVPVGPIALEPYVGYGQRIFKISPLSDDPNPPQVAGVDYRHVKAGSAVRFDVTKTLALTAGGYYLHILSAGQITRSAQVPDFDKNEHYFFPKSSMGGEGFAGAIVALPFLDNLDARVTIDFRRIVMAFDVTKGDPRIAGGATDQFVGLNLAVGYNLGL